MSDDTRHKRAVVRVSPQLIVGELHFPEGTEIVGCEWDFTSNSILFHVRNPSLAEVPVGCPAPHVNVMITTAVDIRPEAAFKTYSSVFQ